MHCTRGRQQQEQWISMCVNVQCFFTLVCVVRFAGGQLSGSLNKFLPIKIDAKIFRCRGLGISNPFLLFFDATFYRAKRLHFRRTPSSTKANDTVHESSYHRALLD